MESGCCPPWRTVVLKPAIVCCCGSPAPIYCVSSRITRFSSQLRGRTPGSASTPKNQAVRRPWKCCCRLVPPCPEPPAAGGSLERYGGPYFLLSREDIAWFWDQYLPPALPRGSDPLAEPLYGRFEGLPPLCLAVAGCDPLADQNFVLAERLRRAGVGLHLEHWPGLCHDCLQKSAELDGAVVAIERLGRWLRGRDPAQRGETRP